MRQAVAGVVPTQLQEAAVMTVWPSVAACWLGRQLGRLYDIRWPDIYFFRLGNLFALASIPIAIMLYFHRLAPSLFGLPLHGVRYVATNRRVVELRSEVRGRMGGCFGVPLPALRFACCVETKSVPLDGFDSIALRVREGQKWFDAADMSFLRDNAEVFRLAGVSRPAAFRHVCLKSHRSYVGVKKALEREAVQA
jgi:hypothetical protein